MSEEQLSALLAKLKEDAGLREKLKSAANLDDATALAKEAGYDVSKADWLKYQAQQTADLGEIRGLELSDQELEGAAGGSDISIYYGCWTQGEYNDYCGVKAGDVTIKRYDC